ncbi:hypothetical protein C497_03920 [Halalkalicoccus jeotgali B3]|uniref:Uncharacterized protein n=1 Tax=Halalkalicoccus jeotgali (strain DSM 18796 / CECT 7217 / JCM 14584 / KCTC 4019 / B3) TaxID=795797 RepID=D8J9Y0_HALJB|nr:hypothetical protein HacjB3_05555 [Halalkalicoccus jeotgali B3]ELY40214.1 hypothetical protein C497_03920 [Halalkalicoccus jeotgali B3]
MQYGSESVSSTGSESSQWRYRHVSYSVIEAISPRLLVLDDMDVEYEAPSPPRKATDPGLYLTRTVARPSKVIRPVVAWRLGDGLWP